MFILFCVSFVFVVIGPYMPSRVGRRILSFRNTPLGQAHIFQCAHSLTVDVRRVAQFGAGLPTFPISHSLAHVTLCQCLLSGLSGCSLYLLDFESISKDFVSTIRPLNVPSSWLHDRVSKSLFSLSLESSSQSSRCLKS